MTWLICRSSTKRRTLTSPLLASQRDGCSPPDEPKSGLPPWSLIRAGRRSTQRQRRAWGCCLMLLPQWSGRTTSFPAFRETENQRFVTLSPADLSRRDAEVAGGRLTPRSRISAPRRLSLRNRDPKPAVGDSGTTAVPVDVPQ